MLHASVGGLCSTWERTSLEPDGLAELHAVDGQNLGEDAAKGTEHGPAGVDHLNGAVPGEGGGVAGEASGVPAIVTGELASQVRGWGP